MRAHVGMCEKMFIFARLEDCNFIAMKKLIRAMENARKSRKNAFQIPRKSPMELFSKNSQNILLISRKKISINGGANKERIPMKTPAQN